MSIKIKIGKIDKNKSQYLGFGRSLAQIEKKHLKMTIEEIIIQMCKERKISKAEIEVFGIEFWSLTQD